MKEIQAILGLYRKGNGSKKRNQYCEIKIEPITVRKPKVKGNMRQTEIAIYVSACVGIEINEREVKP